MPGGDGTGPWWAQGRDWWCRRRYRSFPRGFYRYPMQPAYPVESISLTKEEQKKILEEEKKDLELEIKAIQEEMESIQKKLKELK